MSQDGLFFLDMKPNNPVQGISNPEANPKIHSKQADIPEKRIKNIPQVEEKPKKEKSKEEKKGFWSKLFGR